MMGNASSTGYPPPGQKKPSNQQPGGGKRRTCSEACRSNPSGVTGGVDSSSYREELRLNPPSPCSKLKSIPVSLPLSSKKAFKTPLCWAEMTPGTSPSRKSPPPPRPLRTPKPAEEHQICPVLPGTSPEQACRFSCNSGIPCCKLLNRILKPFSLWCLF